MPNPKTKRNSEKKISRRKKAAQSLRETAHVILFAQDMSNPKKRVWLLVPYLVSSTFKIIANIIDPNTKALGKTKQNPNTPTPKQIKNDN